MNTEPTKIEYRVIPLEGYVVTRYEEHGENAASSVERGRYSSPHVAQEVAYALAKAEHDRLGWAPGDERIVYPLHPLDAAEAEQADPTAFSAPVEGVLNGARHLTAAAVVGWDDEGNDYVASSVSTPETLGLFKRARENIKSGRYS